ncbi:MAG: hypothetical protein ACRBG0_05925 [Lewinella sp.]|uniref:T9SS type A sorting domain-containing protein n=1 Tax=Lewinella sp. TaxID=2004506 RepID=UPI003D6C027E
MRQFTLLFSFCLLLTGLYAQEATSLEVYNILQEKCATCHSGVDAPAGLDLQGSGATLAARMQDVYTTLYNQTPANATAAAKGDAYIYPGRADRSFLFRKMNSGLEPTVHLEAGGDEGQSMPPYGQPVLTNVEKELIRQWILYGAPAAGTVVDRAILESYYDGMAQASFPDGPPPAPAPEEGFQIKMGPFYLAPGDELEYFQKYELELPEEIEVNRLDMKIGTYSHHFIMYNFGPGGDAGIAEGFRTNPFHNNVKLVAAIQEPTDLELPENTAFRWDEGLIADLNSHYINYSATLVYQAEVYVNVYTQPTGTAAQEMFTELLVKGNIPIPNNESTITHTQVVNPNWGEVYLWGLMGHTHKYGTSYKAWRREGLQATEMLYDAACPRGEPGCVSPYFDYRHIPFRYFEPLEPVTMNFANGLIHEAKWVNDGPVSVNFGPTSDDEMMVMVAMYTEDSTGVQVVPTEEIVTAHDVLKISPSPASDWVQVQSPDYIQDGTFVLFDATGRQVWQQSVSGTRFLVERGVWPAGMYWYQLQTSQAKAYTGKILWLE